MILIFLIVAAFNYDKIYPFVTFIILPVSMILIRYLFKQRWISKFYIIYAVLLFPFLIVNGLLTGTGLKAPVVWYNEQEIIGLRIMTIPVEDVFYGMALILMNLQIYLYLKRPAKKISD